MLAGMECASYAFTGCVLTGNECAFKSTFAYIDFHIHWSVQLIRWDLSMTAAVKGTRSGARGLVKPPAGQVLSGTTEVAQVCFQMACTCESINPYIINICYYASAQIDSTIKCNHALWSNVVSRIFCTTFFFPHRLSVVPSFFNDTTAPSGQPVETGCRVFRLPNNDPSAVLVTEHRVNAATTWQLLFQLQRAETVFETKVTMQQTPLQLLSSVMATLASVLAVWKTLFGVAEKPLLSAFTRCRRRREQSNDGDAPPKKLEEVEVELSASVEMSSIPNPMLPNPTSLKK